MAANVLIVGSLGLNAITTNFYQSLSNLPAYQKGIYSFGIKAFSNLLPSITNLTSADTINW
jgi:hypothetical protein